MDVAVVVPFRASDVHREGVWRWLRAQWETVYPGWEIIIGTCPNGPWVKGLAVRNALNRTLADVVVLADADVWSEGVAAAVDIVGSAGGWAIPHWRVHRLDQASTRTVLEGGWFDETLACEERHMGCPGGGMTVIERGLLERAPLDPRFVGWGQEDQAAGQAWETLGGRPWRGKDPLWHLWHPPQPRLNRRTGSPESADLRRRYRDAFHAPELMVALIDEVREVMDA